MEVPAKIPGNLFSGAPEEQNDVSHAPKAAAQRKLRSVKEQELGDRMTSQMNGKHENNCSIRLKDQKAAEVTICETPQRKRFTEAVICAQNFNDTIGNPLSTRTQSPYQVPDLTQFPSLQQLHQRQIKVGILIPDNASLGNDSWILGYDTNAGAATIALDRITQEQLLPNTNFTFVWYFANCDESRSAGFATRLIREDKVDVVLGPVCTDAVRTAGVLGKAYNVPFLIWGAVIGSEVADNQRFPTLTINVGTTWSLVLALISVFEKFGWNEYAFLYAPRRAKASALARCGGVQEDIDVFLKTNMTLLYKRNIANDTYDQLLTVMEFLKNRARVIVGCFEIDLDRRNFMLAAAEAGLNTDEYVFVLLEIRRAGFGNPPFWLDADGEKDGKDTIVKGISDKVLIIDAEVLDSDDAKDFGAQVLQKMHEWPFYCDYCSLTANVSAAAQSLADVFYAYGLSLNRSIAQYGEAAIKNGTLLSINTRGEFKGFSGRVLINEKGVRRPVYNLVGMNAFLEQTVFAVITTEDENSSLIPYSYSPLYDDESTGIWAVRPLSHPLCGFDGSKRPKPFFQEYWLYLVGTITIVMCIATIIIYMMYLTIRRRKHETARLDALWQIGHAQLERRREKESSRSFLSIGSQYSNSQYTQSHRSLKADTENVQFCIMDGISVIARKHSPKFTPSKITEQDRAQLRYMRQLDHSNLNKFLGLYHDSVQYLSVWAYCERGNLSEVIEQYSANLDGFILTSMIRDICHGLVAIHTSTALDQFHGSLTSNCIVVNDRWQLKIQYYGLQSLKLASIEETDSTQIGNLWSAPEILRDRSLAGGTQKGDIYSFAIICSEIITRKSAWNLEDIAESEDQVIYRVRRGGVPPARPNIAVDPTLEINPTLFHLIRDCWNEEPEKRPRIELVRDALKTMFSTKATNLMDYIFTLLESNATQLTQVVDERTKELIFEKKKADILLYRLLPRLVADRMKLGQAVTPELFEAVTVFFSDVVSFTILASRSTPLQVVNLLNDLYTTFDLIIDEYNVYKVETIGDGLHCVSGLPTRNGNEHVRQICGMAFGFLRSIKTFKVPHLPQHQINIRIGIHTGPCVAGVVGLTAPRYCVFGDTVNLAARMESTGRIHISAETNRYLTENFKGQSYVTKNRGEVLIKGAKPAETFWLIPPDEQN
ncbi:adenylate and guanylate cyclase catalytic domain-containing protein [Ditylenchus destructor]|uniref:Guanylate cyclase n=1 Tax=Ditylenchus destructor TaxID=166010 RepID=A0AAD4MRF8_9BILA|nr:adenylate and guanylate cyclase catalytic domain-containing protein [Ditylenchus destructor]